MINSLKLLNCLINNNINFFCGVPDSILKFFTQEVVKNKKVVFKKIYKTQEFKDSIFKFTTIN